MAVTNVFDEILFDPTIFTAGDASGGPEYANTLGRNPPTGIYKINVTRQDFQHVWSFDLNLLTSTKREYIMNIWGGGYGSGYPLRVWIYLDFYTKGEILGTSDGTNASKTWRLTKKYRRPNADHVYTRRIIKPVVNALVSGGVSLFEADGGTPRIIPSSNGAGLGVPAFTLFFDYGPGPVATTAYVINNTTGVITLSTINFTADAGTDLITIANHGWPANIGVKFQSTTTLPAPLVAGTTYFIRDVTTNSFKVSATPGGAAIDLTTAGTGTHSVSGPPVGTLVSWSGEFDTPMRFLQNSLPFRADVASEVKGIQMVEVLPAELGIV